MGEECGLTSALAVMVGKWKPLIMWEISEHGPLRFSQLHRALAPVSEKVLTQQLREMEIHGLISRTVYPVVPPHVEYAGTDLGVSLNDALRPLGEWGLTHADHVRAVTADRSADTVTR
jgi:DNA-binding HxlR family transcriptional regulator